MHFVNDKYTVICGELLAKHCKVSQIVASTTFIASAAFITFIIFYYFCSKTTIKGFFL